jgi:hypothetical protein
LLFYHIHNKTHADENEKKVSLIINRQGEGIPCRGAYPFAIPSSEPLTGLLRGYSVKPIACSNLTCYCLFCRTYFPRGEISISQIILNQQTLDKKGINIYAIK